MKTIEFSWKERKDLDFSTLVNNYYRSIIFAYCFSIFFLFSMLSVVIKENSIRDIRAQMAFVFN